MIDLLILISFVIVTSILPPNLVLLLISSRFARTLLCALHYRDSFELLQTTPRSRAFYEQLNQIEEGQKVLRWIGKEHIAANKHPNTRSV